MLNSYNNLTPYNNKAMYCYILYINTTMHIIPLDILALQRGREMINPTALPLSFQLLYITKKPD